MNYEYRRRRGIDKGVLYDLHRLVRRMKPGDQLTVDSLAELALETGRIFRFLRKLHARGIKVESRAGETSRRMVARIVMAKINKNGFAHPDPKRLAQFTTTRAVPIDLDGTKLTLTVWNQTALAEMREIYRYYRNDKTITRIGRIMRRRHHASWRYLTVEEIKKKIVPAVVLYKHFNKLGIEPECTDPMTFSLCELKKRSVCRAFPLACAPAPRYDQ